MRVWVETAVLGALWWIPTAVQSQDIVISEMLAASSSAVAASIRDSDGELSDWVELYHGGEALVNLAGWALTDEVEEPQKWVFPNVEMRPGEFLLVFASGKDRRLPPELHTNFKLARSGEFLALIRPDLSVASAFTPEFPEQQLGSSFGRGMEHSVLDVVPTAGTGRYFAAPLEFIPQDWTGPDFDDSRWSETRTPLGYDGKDPATFASLIETDLETEIRTRTPTIAVRMPFQLESSAAIQALRLTMRYEAGFVAYINGTEVARRNVSSGLAVLGPRRTDSVLVPEVFSLPISAELLRNGGNVLGILGFNDTVESLDFLLAPLLEASTNVVLDSAAPRFFADATPRWPNAGQSGSSFAEATVFSSPGTAFTGSFLLEITSPSPGAEIRYTLDGTEPRAQSPLYAAPLELTRVTRVRARGFEPGRLPGPITEETFVAFEPDVFTHDSDLPLVIVTSFGGSVGGAWTSMQIQMIDRQADGRTLLDAPRHHSGLGAIKTRGSSTGGREKASYSVELQDESGADRKAEILGMAEASDWILYGAFNFDRALLRNPFVYELSRRVGRWATDSRFCEVFLYTAGETIGVLDYRGVYSFMEKINRDKDRVDVEKLGLTDNAEPEVTGGYIFKVDRLDPGDEGFAGGGQRFAHVYPKEEDITPAQLDWLSGYMDTVGDLLPTVDTPAGNYEDFIDVVDFIDHHILNELTKNPDGFRLSAYYHKPREEKLRAGPVWDFDRTIGPSDDGRAGDPVGWSGAVDAGWWGRLRLDEAFMDRYRERWKELRARLIEVDHMNSIIDDLAGEVREAQARNFDRWRLPLGDDGWEGQVDHMKNWLRDRVSWMDSSLLTKPPSFSHPGGQVEKGLLVEISADEGEIFYTDDRSDPRTLDGEVGATAIAYSGPILIDRNVQLRTRARVEGELWSEFVTVTFVTDRIPIAVTEVMYNPVPPEDAPLRSVQFEWFELQNVGDAPVDISFLRFERGLTFDFTGAMDPILNPGAVTVLVQNLEAFEFQYDTSNIRVAGEFDGLLGNGAQLIRTIGPFGEEATNVTYRGDWYPEARNDGHSIELLSDPRPARELWSEPSSWRPSAAPGGTPGRVEGAADPGGGRQRPADLNQDAAVNLVDGIALLGFLVGTQTPPCATDAANAIVTDINGDGRSDLSDAAQLLNFLFLRGTPPALGTACVVIQGCPEACGG